MSICEHWPLFGLRVHTPRIELRYPSDEEVAELAELSAVVGVHDPAYMPFVVEWTDVPAPIQQRNTMQHYWEMRAGWKPEQWTCPLITFVDGRIVGMQGFAGANFALLRTVKTGSYLLRPEQGKGVGSEMRAAILHLAFAGLDAEFAETGAWADNLQSLGVTTKLGYEPQGRQRLASRGQAREQILFRMERATWAARRRDDIEIEGLDACRALFGGHRP